jgi:transposase
MNGILWILRNCSWWTDLRQRYPPYQTCHRSFQQWFRYGIFHRITLELVEDLYGDDQIDICEDLIDGCFALAKRELFCFQDKAWQRHKDLINRRRSCSFFAAYVESTSPHEVKLVEATIDSNFTRYAPLTDFLATNHMIATALMRNFCISAMLR